MLPRACAEPAPAREEQPAGSCIRLLWFPHSLTRLHTSSCKGFECVGRVNEPRSEPWGGQGSYPVSSQPDFPLHCFTFVKPLMNFPLPVQGLFSSHPAILLMTPLWFVLHFWLLCYIDSWVFFPLLYSLNLIFWFSPITCWLNLGVIYTSLLGHLFTVFFPPQLFHPFLRPEISSISEAVETIDFLWPFWAWKSYW